MFRTALTATSIPRLTAARSLHSTPVACKSVTDTIKDTAQSVNKKVGEALAGGIDKGEKVAQKTKETVGTKAEEADAKKNQAAAGANQAKQDFKKEVNKPV